MRDPLNSTKVVLRHLPPSMSQSALTEQIDGRFSGRYKWLSFRPGKISQKNQRYSRAYIDFQSSDDVVNFAEFFDGHIFVNEKGAQLKALVEYAPSQRVPEVSSKKDGREGTILKDPEYVKFLDFISKPVENLPSAEIQLERREAERSGGAKEAVIVTPLMQYIRQKRADKDESRRSFTNVKISKRAGGSPSSNSSFSKGASGKRRGPASVYVLKDSAKSSNGWKDKPAYKLVSRKDDQTSKTESSDEGTIIGSNGTVVAATGSVEIGKKRVVLLKGKEREASHVSGSLLQQKNATASVRNLTGSSSKQSQRQEASGRIIRSILSNNDMHQNQSHSGGTQSEQPMLSVKSERDKRPPRPNSRLILKDRSASISTHLSVPGTDGKRSLDVKSAVNNFLGPVSSGSKNEKHVRSRDRPDRGVWTPRHSDGFGVPDNIYRSARQLSDSMEGISISQETIEHKDVDDDMGFQSAHGRLSSNSVAVYDAPSGAHRHIGRRGSGNGVKEVDGSLNFVEGKQSKRGVSAAHCSNDKQVWVQKSGFGS